MPRNGADMPNGVAKPRMDQYQKTDRAFHAYIDLLDAAEHMRARVYDQLTFYGLTMSGFRVMYLLVDEGPMRATAMAKRCQWHRQNLDVVVKKLASKEWVESELVTAGAEASEAQHDAPEERGNAGRRIAVLRLTDEGKEFMRRFLPRHGKVVKAYMRALDGREQRMLSRLCQKLKEGDVLKFISEMEHPDN